MVYTVTSPSLFKSLRSLLIIQYLVICLIWVCYGFYLDVCTSVQGCGASVPKGECKSGTVFTNGEEGN